jgi:hypothetical protein
MKKIFVPLAVSVLAGLTAQASVLIINENFDPSLSAGANFSSYSFGDTTSVASGIVGGVGVGGTSGWQVVNNAASGANGFSGVGAQYQNGGVTGNTSINLSDYTLSFDANATAGSLNIQVQSWTGAGFGGTMTGTLNTAPVAGFGDDLTLNGTYTHYSLNLGDGSVWHNNTGFLPNGGTIQIAMQFDGGGPTPYANTMNIDNFQLSMVPEPTIMALTGAGIAMTGLLIRRRKA